MGRVLKHFGRSAGLAVATFGLLWLSAPTSAVIAPAAAQTYPIISLQTPLARDAQTQPEDEAVVKQCMAGGADKAVCLCVTHVMKYELTLSEYKAGARLYGQPRDRTELHRELRLDGFSASDISTAEQMERSLVEDSDFALRCAEAKAYYRTSNNSKSKRRPKRG